MGMASAVAAPALKAAPADVTGGTWHCEMPVVVVASAAVASVVICSFARKAATAGVYVCFYLWNSLDGTKRRRPREEQTKQET